METEKVISQDEAEVAIRASSEDLLLGQKSNN